MEAVRLHAPGLDGLVVETIETPRLRPGEALVRVHAAVPADVLAAKPSTLDRVASVAHRKRGKVVLQVAED